MPVLDPGVASSLDCLRRAAATDRLTCLAAGWNGSPLPPVRLG
jgi:hypothetical protein